MATNKSTAFYLTLQGELVARDIQTGQQVGIVQFSNGDIHLDADKGYFVATSENNIFVYFGDSRQLFSLKYPR